MKNSSLVDDVFYSVYHQILAEHIATISRVDNISRMESLPISEADFEQFVECACFPVVKKIWERLLILEMNLADQDGLLQGKSESERFAFFVREVSKQENLAALYKKYPRLQLTWQWQIKTFLASLALFFERIASDLNFIAKYFYNDDAIAKISNICMLGDPHRKMQQTAQLEYISGDGNTRTLYYKPRNLAVDEGFYNFIAWWNQQFPIDHLLPRVYNKGQYGWAESIATKECEEPLQVQAYYRRYGSLVALAYSFCAIDLHMENIIACGEYPVIVDLETLFSCTLDAEKHSPTDNHLYSSLLLPTETMYNELEISPLSAQANAQTNIDILVNPQKKVSSLKMERKKLKTGSNQSQVILNGRMVNFIQYEEDILLWMKFTLLYIYKNKQKILKKLKENFGNAEIRIVKQATEEYVKILQNICHPIILRKNHEGKELYKLCDPDRDTDVMDTEISDLKRGDVPYLYMPFNSPNLFNGYGEKLATIIYQSPCQKLERQLLRLSPASIEQVIEDARYAFLVYRLRKNKGFIRSEQNYKTLASMSDHQWLDKLAYIVMTRVLDSALHLEGKVYWRNIFVNDDLAEEDYLIRAGLTSTDLYQGSAGIALAFHIVGQRLSCRHFTDFSQKLSDQIIEQHQTMHVAEPGSLNGIAGILWSLCVINQAQLTKLLPIVDRELNKISYHLFAEKLENYKQIEYLGGISGSLSMLLRLHSFYRDYPIAGKLEQILDGLFKTLKHNARSLIEEETTLLGFAHGTAGVSASLAEYMTYFQQKDKEAIAIIAYNVERENRYKTEQGWPRLGNDRAYSTSWCHGTAGIGYSRLHCRPYLPAETYNADITTIKARLGEPRSSHGLCHGMMADYCLAKALGCDGTDILRRLRADIENDGINTDFGLNGYELVGAMCGVTSLFTGDAIFLNRY